MKAKEQGGALKVLGRRLHEAWCDLVRKKGRAAVRMRHTRAHTGVAGNEAADATAKAATAGDDYETQRYDEVARETYEEYRGKSPPGQHSAGGASA